MLCYESSFISNLLKCQHCSNDYDQLDQPKILVCCSKTVCNFCVSKIINSTANKQYICISCKESGFIPEKGFALNTLAVQLILQQPKEVYRGEKYKELKLNLAELANLIKKSKSELKTNGNSLEQICNTIRQEITKAFDERLTQLNKLHASLLQKVNDYETDHLKSSNEEDSLHKQQDDDLINEGDLFIQEQATYLSRPEINDTEMNISIEKAVSLQLEIEKMLAKKSVVLRENLIKFDADKTPLSESIIGRITFAADKSSNMSLLEISNKPFKTLKKKARSLHLKKEMSILANAVNDSLDFSTNDEILDCSKPKFLTCSADQKFKLWDLTSRKLLKTYKGHMEEVNCVVTLEKQRIASCSTNLNIKIWNMVTGKSIADLIGHRDFVNWILLLRADKLASCSDDKSIRIWNLNKYECIKVLEGHTGKVLYMKAISSKSLLSGSADRTLKLWDLNTDTCTRTFVGHTDEIRGIDSLPCEKIVSCSSDQTLKIWDLNTGNCLTTLEGHVRDVSCVKAWPDKEIMISASSDSYTKVWCLKSFKCIHTLENVSEIYSLEILAENKFVSCLLNGRIKIWNIDTKECIEVKAHSKSVKSAHMISLLP